MARRRASGLTARQREWLGHLRRAWGAGEPVRRYARRHALSEHALYQAAKDLRRKGVLPPSERSAKARSAVKRARFVEVRATGPLATEAPPSAWRARLPNGVVVEGSGELGGVLAALAGL